MQPDQPKLPKRSRIGLNAANFFQAEMVGVIMPVLNAVLKEANWRYDAIGFATAAGGLGTLLLQSPAGWLTDKVTFRRTLFAIVALVTGACFVLLPFVPRTPAWVDSLLFISGAVQTLFGPLLGALALALAGHRLLNRVMGANQSWNHAGNIAAALLAMALVSAFGPTSIFYSVGACSILAGASVLLIRETDLDERVAAGLTQDQDKARGSWMYLLKDRTVRLLLLAIFLFHLANAPILPTVALYVKKLGGSDNWMTATVLTAQVVMVPVALLAGRCCDSWGRKTVMAIAFWVLPVRIVSYAFVSSPSALVYLQGLDGIGAGIYGVAVVAMCADLTRGKGGFNTLAGLFATALAVGGVVGPITSGLLVQHLGFKITFFAFAALASVGAAVFTKFIPETRTGETKETDGIPDAATASPEAASAKTAMDFSHMDDVHGPNLRGRAKNEHAFNNLRNIVEHQLAKSLSTDVVRFVIQHLESHTFYLGKLNDATPTPAYPDSGRAGNASRMSYNQLLGDDGQQRNARRAADRTGPDQRSNSHFRTVRALRLAWKNSPLNPANRRSDPQVGGGRRPARKN
jgi:MFS family permease